MQKINKPSILFMIPSLVGGGAERSLLNLLNALDESRIKVTVVVVSYVGIYKDKLPDYVKVVPLFKSNFLVRVFSFLQKKVGFKFWLKYAISRKVFGFYDKAISYLDGNITDGLFYVKASEYIAYVHTSYKSNENHARFYKDERYKQKLISDRYGRLDHLLFVSRDAMAEFISVFGTYRSMLVIPNIVTVNENERHNVISQSYNFPNQLSCIAVGNLLPVKGYDLLIEAIRILRDTRTEIELTILGDGYLRKQLQGRIDEYGLGNKINLAGYVTNVSEFVAKADLFVMTSLSEALPTALIEAMMLGKPVLVTNCSGCREVVENGEYGLMVDISEVAIANGIMSFIREPNKLNEYSQLAREGAKRYLPENILKQFNELLELN